MENKSTSSSSASKLGVGNEHDLTKKIADVSEKVLDQVDSAVETIQKTSADSAKKIEEYVHENPLKAVLIALAAGALAAILIRH